MLYWTPSKCCPIFSAFAFHIHHPPSTTPTLLMGCFLHLYSANTIGLHDQQHRGKSCKITGRSPPFGISHQEWLHIWDSFEQTWFGSGGLRHDIKRHIAAGAQGEAMWVKEWSERCSLCRQSRGKAWEIVPSSWHCTDRRGFKATKWRNFFAFSAKCYTVSHCRVQRKLVVYCWILKSQLCSFYPLPMNTGSWPHFRSY